MTAVRARAERGVACLRRGRRRSSPRFGVLSTASHGYLTLVIYNTNWANLRPMVSFLLVSVNNHRKRRSWVQSLWVFSPVRVRSYAKKWKNLYQTSEEANAKAKKKNSRMWTHFAFYTEDARKPWRIQKGLSCLWGEFLSLEKTDGKLKSVSHIVFQKNKVRMNLVLFFVVSCLALHCGQGKLVFGWPLFILGAGCHRRLYLVGFRTGSCINQLGALLTSTPAGKWPQLLSLIGVWWWMLSFLLSACCESRKWVRVNSHLEGVMCVNDGATSLCTRTHTAGILPLKCQDPDNMMIGGPHFEKEKGGQSPPRGLSDVWVSEEDESGRCLRGTFRAPTMTQCDLFGFWIRSRGLNEKVFGYSPRWFAPVSLFPVSTLRFTVNKSHISRALPRGKAFVIDVWSTCGNFLKDNVLQSLQVIWGF